MMNYVLKILNFALKILNLPGDWGYVRDQPDIFDSPRVNLPAHGWPGPQRVGGWACPQRAVPPPGNMYRTKQQTWNHNVIYMPAVDRSYLVRGICIHNNAPQFAPDFGSKFCIRIPRSRYTNAMPGKRTNPSFSAYSLFYFIFCTKSSTRYV